MQILEVTSKKARLNISNNEINILNTALTEVIKTVPNYGFETRIDLSREKIIILQNKISKILNDTSLTIETEFTRQEMLGIKNSLNEICNGITVNDFDIKIGTTKKIVKTLLESFFETTEIMFSEEIKFKVGHRAIQYSKLINPFSVTIPRLLKTRRKCSLLIDRYQVLFLLFSLENSKTFSGIQILIIKQNNLNSILFKTAVQKINISDLIQMIAYFDEYIDTVKNNYMFNKYILSAFDYDNNHIFNIQVLSGDMISKQEGFLDLGFKINVSKEKNINKYFDVQAPVNFDEIYNFTSAIKEYLVETVNIANSKQ